ncbi:MarR family transcriptional regulator [Aurantiacibacter sp. MUD61]|uniref:MarR family transcriptional regulator n=1 Tax=Aurantiacibacter sp. MUD61 TaxID=3009083 RepID=UPI0022EFEE21|nr:MarR family transcriptional regulator [Aurantiacibacter sp. MUD61]
MLLNDAYLGKRLQDLLTVTEGQMKSVYAAHGLVIPVEGSSTLHILAPGTWMSLTEIARDLGQSHQLIAQRIDKLLKLKLVTKRDDPEDGRRSEYGLTPAGQEQWQRLDQLMLATTKVNQQLFEEIGCHLIQALDTAREALIRQDYQTRFGTITSTIEHEEART